MDAKHLQALIFDMDGTLADTEELHRQSFNDAFREHGLDWNWNGETYTRLLHVSGGQERMRHYLERLPEDRQPALTASDILRLHQRKSLIYRSKLADCPPKLRPGVRRLLLEAREQGVALGVATSSSMENLRALLRRLLGEDPSEWFQSVVTQDRVAEKKPSPKAYRQALHDLAVDAKHAVALEDCAPGNLAARGCGLTTVITTHPLSETHPFEGAALVADSLGEPDMPCVVRAGDAHGHSYVNLQLLDQLSRAQVPPQVARNGATRAQAGN